MGDIATRLSNYVIFTSDNPRNEDVWGWSYECSCR